MNSKFAAMLGAEGGGAALTKAVLLAHKKIPTAAFPRKSTFQENLVVTLQYEVRHYACAEDEEFLSRRPSRGTRC